MLNPWPKLPVSSRHDWEVKDLEGVKKRNANLKYLLAKKEGDLKLKKHEELQTKDQALVVAT